MSRSMMTRPATAAILLDADANVVVDPLADADRRSAGLVLADVDIVEPGHLAHPGEDAIATGEGAGELADRIDELGGLKGRQIADRSGRTGSGK